MAVVSTLGGLPPDKRQGYDSGVRYTAEEEAEYWRRRNAGKVRHPSEIKAQQAQREIEREAERKAATPDPRQSLRDAHLRRTETRDELDRIVELRSRAADLVRDLEQRHQHLTDEVRAANCAAADQLVAALQESVDDLPLSPWAEGPMRLSPGTEAAQAQLIELAGKLGVARDAQAELSERHRKAVAAVREAEAGVARCAVALAIDHAVRESVEIEERQAELQARRATLNSLSSAITSAIRQLPFTAGLHLPPICSRVLAGLDARVDVRWAEKLKALTIDSEAEL